MVSFRQLGWKKGFPRSSCMFEDSMKTAAAGLAGMQEQRSQGSVKATKLEDRKFFLVVLLCALVAVVSECALTKLSIQSLALYISGASLEHLPWASLLL